MKAKHTPGPWTVSPSAKASTLTRIFSVNEERLVASASGPGLSESGEAEANARLIAASPMLLEVCDRTPNPSGSGTMSNYHIMLMAVVALRNEGHLTLANELEAIQQHQKVAIAKATQP